MAPGQRIVLDANILIRAVLGVRVRRIITDHAVRAEFLAPEVAYADAERYLPEILAKHDREDEIDHALSRSRKTSRRSCCRCPKRSMNIGGPTHFRASSLAIPTTGRSWPLLW